MTSLLLTSCHQAVTFLPLAVALYISFYLLRAIDLTLDGSFVLGAAIFARLLELNLAPVVASIGAVVGGIMIGLGVGAIQRGQKINSLLAGVLATFILLSGNLLIMGRPNISLLNQATLVSGAFAQSQLCGQMLVAALSLGSCLLIYLILSTRFGLMLRAFGDNPQLLRRLGKPIEIYRVLGFALTNSLAAISGCLTAQTVGYADIGMSMGITLTALGVVILGKQVLALVLAPARFKLLLEFGACLLGAVIYFLAINGLLRLELNPLYLKMLLGGTLIAALHLMRLTSQQVRL